MADTETDPIRIDIVSDVVCPWCVIGYKQLERALELTGIDADVYWHPFELNPRMRPEGENLRAHLAAKYGTTPEGSRQARARLTAMGAELGFEFAYADDMKMYNTFLAHQLLHWAEASGQRHALEMALFEAFFTHRRDVSDIDVLVDVAEGVSLDAAEARTALVEGRFAATVREQEMLWTSRGITGVPAMVFDQRFLVTGAQGVDGFASVLGQVAGSHAA